MLSDKPIASPNKITKTPLEPLKFTLPKAVYELLELITSKEIKNDDEVIQIELETDTDIQESKNQDEVRCATSESTDD